jgi:hypothetical protein
MTKPALFRGRPPNYQSKEDAPDIRPHVPDKEDNRTAEEKIVEILRLIAGIYFDSRLTPQETIERLRPIANQIGLYVTHCRRLKLARKLHAAQAAHCCPDGLPRSQQ